MTQVTNPTQPASSLAGGVGGGGFTVIGTQESNRLNGGPGSDIIQTFAAADVIAGGSGNELIISGGGNDSVGGGDGNDSLYGGKDNDTVNGGAGNDFISGDRGSDVLTGGDGSDTFYFFSSGGDYGVDTITDFTPGTDKIRLKQGGVFAGLGSTFEATEFVVLAGFNAASPGTATTNKLVYDPTNGALYFNGTNGVLTVAQLQPGLTTITSNSFELF